MNDISGKTAIVTGAASGIGLGVATALVEAGANVVMADIQKDAVEEAAHGLSGTNKRVIPVRVDVTLEQSVVDALSEAERAFGKLHIACNNAGVPMHGTRLIDVPPGDWAFVIGVNVSGIIHGIRHFVPAIRRIGPLEHQAGALHQLVPRQFARSDCFDVVAEAALCAVHHHRSRA
jgi:NAD(P)-dependent dehydrogenase (short-subunit alcohol dehydrogenase family)